MAGIRVDAGFLSPLSDVLQMRLDVSTAGIVTGKVKGQVALPDGPTFPFPLEVVSAVVIWGDAAALLLEGPGDLGLLAEYYSLGQKIWIWVLDLSLIGREAFDLFESSGVRGLPDAQVLVMKGIVCGFRLDHQSKKWTRLDQKKKKADKGPGFAIKCTDPQ